MAERRTLTPEEVAERLRISRFTVYELVKRGELPAYRVGKQVRVDEEDLEAYKARAKAQAGGTGALAAWEVVIASTLGPVDAGILDALEAAYAAVGGERVRHVGAGTGEALRLGRAGQVDLVIVHAPALEERFVAEGHGLARQPLMENDFLVVGPVDDPAGIHSLASAAEAFRRLAAAGALFLSRHDRSGTHVKEEECWAAAGVAPTPPWYRAAEHGTAGNAATLAEANERGAYTLVDRATWVTRRASVALVAHVAGDPLLRNPITAIAVNPARHPRVNGVGATRLLAWLRSPAAQRLIRDFGRDRYGEPLYHPAYPPPG